MTRVRWVLPVLIWAFLSPSAKAFTWDFFASKTPIPTSVSTDTATPEPTVAATEVTPTLEPTVAATEVTPTLQPTATTPASSTATPAATSTPPSPTPVPSEATTPTATPTPTLRPEELCPEGFNFSGAATNGECEVERDSDIVPVSIAPGIYKAPYPAYPLSKASVACLVDCTLGEYAVPRVVTDPKCTQGATPASVNCVPNPSLSARLVVDCRAGEDCTDSTVASRVCQQKVGAATAEVACANPAALTTGNVDFASKPRTSQVVVSLAVSPACCIKAPPRQLTPREIALDQCFERYCSRPKDPKATKPSDKAWWPYCNLAAPKPLLAPGFPDRCSKACTAAVDMCGNKPPSGVARDNNMGQ